MNGVITVGFNSQLVGLVKRDIRTRGAKTVDDEFSGGTKRLITSRFPEHCVVLDEALDAATDSMRGASSGLATILQWSMTDEEYVETDQQLKVWNHSESTDHASDTFGAVRFIDGHYWFFGDCGPMAHREPPEEEGP